MAKNLAPTSPADKQLANELSLKAPSSPVMLDPSAVRATGTAPTDKGQQGLKSGALNARTARKKSGLPNDSDDSLDAIQDSPSPNAVLGADRLETAADTVSIDASSSLEAAKLEASGAELSGYGAQQATVFGEPLVLAQAVVNAPSAATLASATGEASAATAAAASASSFGAGGFMALAGMIVVASRVAATNNAPATQPIDTPTTTPLSLVVQDGYLDGAEVWVDMNDNGVIDTLVDFKFGISVNGKVDGALTDAQKLHALITTGGTDISTGLAFQGSYSATAGSTVVNPLTSLVQSMVQSTLGSTVGMTDAQKLARITEVKAEALAAVNSALGLPVGADLTRIDTISTATASTGDAASGISLEQALEINSKALMVANMMAMGAAALQGAATGPGSVAPSMTTLSNFIVSGIVEAINTASTAGLTVALGDKASLTAILSSASTAAEASGGSFVMDTTKLTAATAAVATSVASTNSLITTLTSKAIADNVSSPGSATGALTQMLAAQKAVLSQLEELQASDLDVLETFTNAATVFAASQSAENTAGLMLGTQAVTAPVIEDDDSHATVTAITVKPVKAGELAQFVVQLSEGVFIQAAGQNKPTIAIQNTATSEAIATYDPGLSSGDKLVFTYKVKDGDTILGVAPGTSIQLPEGSGIMDLAGNEADRNLNSGLQNFQAAEVVGRTLDTLAPTLSITSDKEALKAGEKATITFTFSEDPGISFAWTGSEGDVVVTGGTLSAASDTGRVRTATFTPTADLDSASASITVAGSSFLDAAGNNGNTDSTAAISIDTLAPVANFSAIKNSLGGLLSAGPTNSASLQLSGSNEAGASVSVYNGSTLLGLADVIETGWTYSISTEEGSTYDLRVQETDASGNVGPMTTYFSGAGDAVIDLGEGNGQLIAPVQVDGGKWFYHWDISGDGTAKDQDDNGQPKDYVPGWRLHDIFRNDVNGNVGPGTSETYRYAALNGVHLALPTIGLPGKDLSNPTTLTDAKDWMYIVQASTAIGSVEGEGDNTINPLYDDLLAIWDAHNGTAITAVQIGEPWANEGVRIDLLGVDQSKPIEFTATLNGVEITASQPVNANEGDVTDFFYAWDIEAAFLLAINDYNATNDDALLDISEDLEDVNQLLVTRTRLDGSQETSTIFFDPSTGTANPSWASYDDGTVYILGTPKDWNSAGWGEYASATPSFVWGSQNLERHYDLMFNGGMPTEMSEGTRDTPWNPVMVALEVLGRPVIVRLPNLAPVFDTTGPLAYFENGVGIAYQANATDINQDTVVYGLGGVDAAQFNIVAATGAVTFKAAPDYETPGDADSDNIYNITITASDAVNIPTALAVSLEVLASPSEVKINSRTNENISVEGEADLYSIQLIEGEKYVFTLEATSSSALDAGLNLFGSGSSSNIIPLLKNDNSFYLNNNARITYIAQETGTYYLQANGVSETSGDYVLSVSDKNVPKPSRIAIPNPPTDSASPNPDIQWKYRSDRGTGEEFYLIIDAPKNSPQWTVDNLPFWTDPANRSLLVDIASGKELEQNGDQDGLRSGNIFEWDGPTVQSHVMQDLSRNTDYVYVVPTGALTGANNLTNDYYESTIYHTTNDAAGPKAISGGIIMDVFGSDIFFPVDPSWGNLKLDVASSNTYSKPLVLDDVPDLLWIQFDEKIRSSTGGWNQGWAAKHNDVFDGVYLKENGVAILEFDVNFDDVKHDPNQWGAPFRYPTGLLNVKTTGSEILGGLPWVDYSGLENGMWLNLHQAVSSWGGQYAYKDYVNNYEFKEGAIYTLVVDAPIEDIYFNTSNNSTPLFEFSFIVASQVL